MKEGRARRGERERRRTRDALVSAAQELLAEGAVDPPVLVIAQRAGVSVGSFYNHFGDKPALFGEAAARGSADHSAWLEARTGHIADPWELFGLRMRLFCRMAHTHPTLARLLTNPRTVALMLPANRPGGREIVARAMAVADHPPSCREDVLVALGGALVMVVATEAAGTPVEDGVKDGVVEELLVLVGASRERAAAITALPLPPRDAPPATA